MKAEKFFSKIEKLGKIQNLPRRPLKCTNKLSLLGGNGSFLMGFKGSLIFTDSDFSFATIKSLCTVFSMIFYIFKNKTFFKPKFPSSSFLIHKLVIVLENRLIYNQLLVYNEHLRVNESRFMYYISKI